MAKIITVLRGVLLLNLAAVGALAWLLFWIFTTVRSPSLPRPPLQNLAAKRQVAIGNYLPSDRLHDSRYTSILTGQYGFLTIDGDLNWTYVNGTLRPAPDKYDFSRPDKVMAFAQAHNMPVEAHHLVWGEEKWLPAWLKNGDYSAPQLLDLMHRHIRNVASRYSGRIKVWSVVNEAFTRGQHVKGLRDWWADHIGDDNYINQAFIWARQADPHAKLILNDFNNETVNPISNAMYEHIRRMLAFGIPIDGIGMQMHIDGSNPPAKAAVIDNMRRFGALGIKVYVTEFDVDMSHVPGGTQERFQREGDIYYQMARACIESRVCVSFAELGITDKDSWLNDLGVKNADPLPFTDDYEPKPAFYSLRAAFAQP